MNYYDFIVVSVREAGDLLMRLREEKFDTLEKAGNPRDIVTSVDFAVNEFLIGKIREMFPGDAIYSEEEGGIAEGGNTWAIDPIDGSSNFSRGIPHFSVCLGVLEGGVPVAGAVYNPVTRELFSFKKGGGAFLNGKPIHVSTVSDLAKAQVVFSPGSRKSELWDWAAASYRKLLEHSLKRGMYGSSALDLCFVASGRADVGVYGTLSTLDIAAAIGILLEAGGRVVTKKGEPIAFSAEPQTVIMANGEEIERSVLKLLF